MNKEQLRKKCYEMGNSQLPVDVFYNDIRDNKSPNFNKEEAYADLEKIVDYIKELRKSIKSWNENAGNLLKENTKLKKAIKILKRNYLAVGENRNSDTGYIISIESDITKQEYELFKEILGNVKRN